MDILKICKDFAKPEYEKHDPMHRWSHVEEVMNIALKLVKFYPDVDLEILKLAIILHDINYDNHATHVDRSIQAAEIFLKKNKYCQDKIDKVLTVMVHHSGPHRVKLGDTDLIEGKILYDSDKFRCAKNAKSYKEYKKYYDWFYLDETRELLKNEREKGKGG